MSTTVLHPPSSKATTTTIKPKKSPLPKLRKEYEKAQGALIIRDYQHSLRLVIDALAKIRLFIAANQTGVANGEDREDGLWIRLLEQQSQSPAQLSRQSDIAEILELTRRFQCLRLTIIASASDSSNSLIQLVALDPVLKRASTFNTSLTGSGGWVDLVPSLLWSELCDPQIALNIIEKPSIEAPPTPLTTHPSLISHLILLALSMNKTWDARMIAECWMVSLDERVENLVLSGSALDHDIDNNQLGMENSISSISSTLEGQSKPQKALLKLWASYLHIHQLYIENVLCALGEWEQAEVFLGGLGRDSGGFMSNEWVDGMTASIREMQQFAADEELMRFQQKAQLSQAKAIKPSVVIPDQNKATKSESTRVSEMNESEKKTNGNGEEKKSTGFAKFRDELSSFQAQAGSETQSTTSLHKTLSRRINSSHPNHAIPRSPQSRVIHWLKHEPFRVLGWLRSVRILGVMITVLVVGLIGRARVARMGGVAGMGGRVRQSVGNWWGLVVDTVKMGTTVSTL